MAIFLTLLVKMEHKSDDQSDSLTIKRGGDSLPGPEGDPLDTQWVIRQVFRDVIDLARDPRTLGVTIIFPWAFIGLTFSMLPDWIRQLLPPWLRVLWWIIGGFTFICIALSLALSVRSSPQRGALDALKTWDDIEQDLRSLQYGPAPEGYKRGPKGGLYKIDDKGRKKYI